MAAALEAQRIELRKEAEAGARAAEKEKLTALRNAEERGQRALEEEQEAVLRAEAARAEAEAEARRAYDLVERTAEESRHLMKELAAATQVCGRIHLPRVV